MTAIHETAYPRFKPYLSKRELQEVFLLSSDEIELLNEKTKTQNHISRLGFALLLKCYQHLSRPIQINTVGISEQNPDVYPRKRKFFEVVIKIFF